MYVYNRTKGVGRKLKDLIEEALRLVVQGPRKIRREQQQVVWIERSEIRDRRCRR